MKTNVAEVSGWCEDAWGNSNPRNLQGLIDILFDPCRAGKETAGLDPQAAPTCRKSVISTQEWLMCLGLGLGGSNCTKVFVFNVLLLSLYSIFKELAPRAFKLAFDLRQIDLYITFAGQVLSSGNVELGTRRLSLPVVGSRPGRL